MTNKTTPDDDWLDEILNTLELKIIPEEGYIAPKVHAEAKAAINAKITELLVEATMDYQVANQIRDAFFKRQGAYD
jgi:hypothetical protein